MMAQARELAGLYPLSHTVRLYIPTRTRQGDAAAVAASARANLADWFGGAVLFRAMVHWRTPGQADGVEPMLVVEARVGGAAVEQHLADVYALCEQLMADLGLEQLAVEYDNRVQILTEE